MNQEVDRLMKAALSHLEKTIKEEPGQWLWSHNRWKQQTPERLKKKFRHEAILIILPFEEHALHPLLLSLATFRQIYPHEFITIYVPKNFEKDIQIEDVEIVSYFHENDFLKRDYRFKLVFNLSSSTKVKSHFKKLAALQVISLNELRKEANADEQTPFADILKSQLQNSPPRKNR